MASSSGARVHVACDACGAAAWIGPRPDGGADGWCEACQRPAGTGAGARCPSCGGVPTAGAPRFAELWGQLQHLDAVLAAWDGNPAPLAGLLPERPRFLTDLTPPAPAPGDAPQLRAALEALARGDWRGALDAGEDGGARAHAARAIARERLGEDAAASGAWSAAIASGADARAHLARGALRAKAGDWAGAAADFALAGDGREARWNRAALRLHRAIGSTPGLPDTRSLDAARAEAGPASDYWSDPTVGRLAFSLLAERTVARREAGELGDRDIALLREAEEYLEHATFWDRALVLVAHVRLGPGGEGDAARVARPLARELAAALLAEPPMNGPALAGARDAVAAAYDDVAAFRPRAARAALAPWLEHEALRRYRMPCAACGRGTVGADAWDESAIAEPGPGAGPGEEADSGAPAPGV